MNTAMNPDSVRFKDVASNRNKIRAIENHRYVKVPEK
jgi:hypothetical protein